MVDNMISLANRAWTKVANQLPGVPSGNDNWVKSLGREERIQKLATLGNVFCHRDVSVSASNSRALVKLWLSDGLIKPAYMPGKFGRAYFEKIHA